MNALSFERGGLLARGFALFKSFVIIMTWAWKCGNSPGGDTIADDHAYFDILRDVCRSLSCSSDDQHMVGLSSPGWFFVRFAASTHLRHSLTHSLDLALDFIRRRSWGGVGCDGGRRGWMVDDRLSVRTVFLEPLSRISNIVFGVRLWLDSTGMGLGFVRASLWLLMDYSNWG